MANRQLVAAALTAGLIFAQYAHADGTVTVSTAGATIFSIPSTQGYGSVGVQLCPVGATLTAVTIQASIGGGAFFTLYSTATDYGTPTGLLIAASSTMPTIAASACGFASMFTDGITGIQVTAATATGAATVSWSFTLRN